MTAPESVVRAVEETYRTDGGENASRCVHCGMRLRQPLDEHGWGLHDEGSQRGMSRCGKESEQPYGLNGHIAAVACSHPCAGTWLGSGA